MPSPIHIEKEDGKQSGSTEGKEGTEHDDQGWRNCITPIIFSQPRSEVGDACVACVAITRSSVIAGVGVTRAMTGGTKADNHCTILHWSARRRGREVQALDGGVREAGEAMNLRERFMKLKFPLVDARTIESRAWIESEFYPRLRDLLSESFRLLHRFKACHLREIDRTCALVCELLFAAVDFYSASDCPGSKWSKEFEHPSRHRCLLSEICQLPPSFEVTSSAYYARMMISFIY